MADSRLVRIIHRVAKMTVRLIEEEYGLGPAAKSPRGFTQQEYTGGVVVIRKKILTTE